MKKLTLRLNIREITALESILKAVDVSLAEENKKINEIQTILEKIDKKIGRQTVEHNYSDEMAENILEELDK